MHESVEATASHRLERLADERREACVGVQDVAASRQDHGAFLHLFDEVAVRLLGAVQRVDLIAAGALDDQGVDLALPNRPQHLFGFGEARAQRLGLFAIVGVRRRDHRPYSAESADANEIESKKHALAVRHVADDPAHRQRELLDERRRRDDLLTLREDRLLVDVDDFEIVPPLEILVADRPQVADRTRRSRRHAGDVQPKDVPFAGRRDRPARTSRGGGAGSVACSRHWRTRRSSPTRTRSVFERSPMIFLIGSGSRRTSVGTARIWSPRASCGFSRRSMISIS